MTEDITEDITEGMKKAKKILYKEEVLFITAEMGYVKIGLQNGGYEVLHPYRYKTIVGRLVLELLVQLKLPQRIIFNKKVLDFSGKYIIVHDSIITRQFLLWLKKNHPDKRLIFDYTNMIGKAHHLLPKSIPRDIEIWTYDKHDSEKYGINLSRCGGYPTSFIGEKREKKYDVIYVGKDKGRAEYILGLKKQFEAMGLTTKFLIMPSTRVSKKKGYYSKEIPYQEVIKLVTESRAILNIALPNQKGATMRDYESIFNEVKLITTNANIKELEFYKKQNVFILGEDDVSGLNEFIKSPFEKISENIVCKYSLDSFVEELVIAF